MYINYTYIYIYIYMYIYIYVCVVMYKQICSCIYYLDIYCL